VGKVASNFSRLIFGPYDIIYVPLLIYVDGELKVLIVELE
jgi:hypothetical protein